jgi:hypothetical protein
MNELLTGLRNLSPSDRRALLILAGCGLLFAGFFTVLSVRSASVDSARAAQLKEAEYREVLTLAVEFASAKAEKERLKRRIARSSVQLESDLEAAAGSLGIEIKDMKNQSPVPGKADALREERLRVTIKSITLDRFTQLMGKLLSGRSGDLIRVRELSLKTEFDNRERLSAVFVISTWRRNG